MTKARGRPRAQASPLTFSASGMLPRIVCKQPMLKQILEWGSWTAVKASRAPLQSFLSAASTPSFQRLMVSTRDMVRCKAGGGEPVSPQAGQSWPSLSWPGAQNGAQPPLRQLSVAKAAGNVPTFWQLTCKPIAKEKEREGERGQAGRSVEERGSASETARDAAVPQNASAVSPGSSSPSSFPICGRQLLARALTPGSGRPLAPCQMRVLDDKIALFSLE